MNFLKRFFDGVFGGNGQRRPAANTPARPSVETPPPNAQEDIPFDDVKAVSDACDQLLVELDGVSAESLKRVLIDNFNDPKSKAVRFWFATNKPRWPRYERYIEEQTRSRNKFTEEDAKDIRLSIQNDSVPDLLAGMTVQSIKLVCAELGIKPTGKSKKVELVQASAVLIDASGKANEFRAILARQLEREVANEDEDLSAADWREMAHLFQHRVAMTYYAAGHWRDFHDNKAHRPYLVFDAIDDSRTPSECMKLDGTIKRVDDPFWKAHAMPCERLMCRCTIRSLSEREATAKRGH